MPAERGRCATVQARLRADHPDSLPSEIVVHLAQCGPCAEVAAQYRWLATALRELRDLPAEADADLVSAVGRRVDAEVLRRARRAWTIATVAGGLVVAGAAGVATIARRERVLVGALRG